MAGLPWIKVWTRVSGHPKVQWLEREMGIKDALGVVLRLWCWTADYAPDGEIPESEGITAAKVARGEVNRKPPAAWLESFLTVGLLDRTPTGYRVHDWDEMQTRHVEEEEKRRALAAKRQAAYRERHRNDESNALRNPSRNANVTGQTRQEKTETREDAIGSETASQTEAPSWLAGLQSRLASALGRDQPLGVGKDPSRVVASFGRWLETVGEQETIAECVRLAEEKGVSPSNLSWWPGWLDTVRDTDLRRPM